MITVYTDSEEKTDIVGVVEKTNTVNIKIVRIDNDKFSPLASWMLSFYDNLYIGKFNITILMKNYKCISFKTDRPQFYITNGEQPTSCLLHTLPQQFDYRNFICIPENQTDIDIGSLISFKARAIKDFTNGYVKCRIGIKNYYYGLSVQRYIIYKCLKCKITTLKETFTSDFPLLSCTKCGNDLSIIHQHYIIEKNKNRYLVKIDGIPKGFLHANNVLEAFNRVQNLYPDLAESESIVVKRLSEREIKLVVIDILNAKE